MAAPEADVAQTTGQLPDEDVPPWLARLRARIAAEQLEKGPAARVVRPPAPTASAPPEPSAAEVTAPQDTSPADGEAPAPAADATPETEDAPADDPAWLRDLLAAPAGQSPAGGAEMVAENRAAARRRARKAQRQRRTEAARNSASVSAVRSVVIIVAAAVLTATIFTFWTPADFLSDEIREGLRPAYATLSAQSPPTPIPTPIWLRRVGVVSGHRGPHPSTGRDDPGAVCPDGLTENEINFSVATRVVAILSSIGYNVDLLDEWDPRLDGYQAAALLSIHTDSCHQFDLPGATGFKVTAPASRTTARSDDERLVNCLRDHYAQTTGLPQHPSITFDMTDYHSFREISPVTPAAIIELGFMFEDRAILTGQPDLLAQGIVSGLLCFLEGGPPTPLPEVTPWPTALYTPTPLETPNPS